MSCKKVVINGIVSNGSFKTSIIIHFTRPVMDTCSHFRSDKIMVKHIILNSVFKKQIAYDNDEILEKICYICNNKNKHIKFDNIGRIEAIYFTAKHTTNSMINYKVNGEYIIYYENGFIKSINYLINDKLNGYQYDFDIDGNITKNQYFINNDVMDWMYEVSLF